MSVAERIPRRAVRLTTSAVKVSRGDTSRCRQTSRRAVRRSSQPAGQILCHLEDRHQCQAARWPAWLAAHPAGARELLIGQPLTRHHGAQVRPAVGVHRSARSSSSPAPPPSAPSTTRSSPPWKPGSRPPPPISMTPATTSWRSPRSPAKSGARSGPAIRRSGSAHRASRRPPGRTRASPPLLPRWPQSLTWHAPAFRGQGSYCQDHEGFGLAWPLSPNADRGCYGKRQRPDCVDRARTTSSL
jgi:hypothetical protein